MSVYENENAAAAAKLGARHPLCGAPHPLSQAPDEAKGAPRLIGENQGAAAGKVGLESRVLGPNFIGDEVGHRFAKRTSCLV